MHELDRVETATVAKMTKYHNKRTRGYASKKEADYALYLRQLEFDGRITELQEQVCFELAPSVVIHGRKRPALRYVADFTFWRDGEFVVVDVKGMITPVYRIKRHLMRAIHGIEIEEV